MEVRPSRSAHGNRIKAAYFTRNGSELQSNESVLH